MNVLDTLLSDYVPSKYRRYLHTVLLLLAFLYGLWQASDHDWRKTVVALVVAIYAAANRANTSVTDLDAAGVVEDTDDDTSYEDAGGLPYDGDDDTDLDVDPAPEATVPQAEPTPAEVSGNPRSDLTPAEVAQSKGDGSAPAV